MSALSILFISLASVFASVVTWLALRAKVASVTVRLEERNRELTKSQSETAQAQTDLKAVASERERLRSELDAERATSVERLSAATDALANTRALYEDASREIQQLRAALESTVVERERISGELSATRATLSEREAFWDKTQREVKQAFAAASQEALLQNNQAFLQLAETKLREFNLGAQADLEGRQKAIDAVIQPVAESLKSVRDKLEAFDKDRSVDHATIQEQLRQVAVSQVKLAEEADSLVRALRAPQVRGQWGELQLQRVVELAGMVEHCDFVQQETVTTDGKTMRPDMLVRLPGDKSVVVDSKVPLAAYLDAIDADDDAQRTLLLDKHAKQVRDHIVALSSKDYANQFAEAPDFVVMFLPGESFLSAAFQRDHSLIEFAIQRGVILASPTTLITVLKSVNYGWQQERLGRNAEAIRDLGQTLYERVRSAAEHFAKIKRGLDTAVGAYNSAVGALESRVLPTARRFRDLDAGSGSEIASLEPVDTVPRLLAAPELTSCEPSDAGTEVVIV